MKTLGTVVRGLRAPIIRQGDDLAAMMVDTLLSASRAEGFSPRDGDILAVTEACVARAQGNYATLSQIAADVRRKCPGGVVGVVHPILSRNRFFMLLQGIAQGADRVVVQLSYPADEVGNPLMSLDALDESGVNPYADVLDEAAFLRHFGKPAHPFTGVDYVELYKSAGPQVEIIFANNPRAILDYAPEVITADIHTRERTKRIVRQAGARAVWGIDELLTESVDGSGFNPDFGLLGSNLADDDRVKLFPRGGQALVTRVQQELKEKTGRHIEVLIYGDGAFKDPAAGIWELADPVVSPAFTEGLSGLPHELKIKYLADTKFAGLSGPALTEAIAEYIRAQKDLAGDNDRLGTTPRRVADLVGSLCDLTTGSGDKGTPFVYISGYFDHYGQG